MDYMCPVDLRFLKEQYIQIWKFPLYVLYLVLNGDVKRLIH